MSETTGLRSIGKYELIASLGQGGMANVYLALAAGPAGFNKLLVLKLLREDVVSGMEEGLNMFLDEARLSARLVHPNIVHTYEVGEHEGRYFIAMEYLDGQSYRALQRRARASGGIPIGDELRVIAETALGLHYSHQLKGYDGEPLGVVHRDVSPQNVFLTYDGQVKLLDFGIAKTSEAEHLTQVGVIKGKLDYIAPEQLRGEQLDGRADVFALGAMLWEAVTGKRFAGGPKVADVTKVHLRIAGGETNVRVAQPEIAEELATIIDRAIALHPQDRWPDAGSFAEALDQYLQGTGQKPSGKSLAAFMAPLFEDERLKMSKLVEREIGLSKQRATTRASDTSRSIPRVKLGDDSLSGLFVVGQESLQTPLDSAPRSLAPLSQHKPLAQRTTRLRVVVLAAAVAGALAVAVPLFSSPPEATSPAPSPAPASPAELGAASTAREPSLAPIAAPTTAASTPGLASATLVSLKVTVTPSDARASLDGAPITAPFVGQFRRDLALHHLEVTAPGFRSAKQLLAFDRDHELNIVLEGVPERAPVVRRSQPSERPAVRVSEASSSAVAEAKEAKEAKEAVPQPAARTLGFGEDLKTARPRVSRGHIDSDDPYSMSK